MSFSVLDQFCQKTKRDIGDLKVFHVKHPLIHRLFTYHDKYLSREDNAKSLR